MISVKTYSPVIEDDGPGRCVAIMQESVVGGWVLFAEYMALARQLAAAQSRLAEIEADANRYRYLRRKVCIIQRSGFMGTQADKYADFELINFPKPTYMAPDAACELDAAIDQQITDEAYDALAHN